jgi:putative CocE/NonD family hydrolase
MSSLPVVPRLLAAAATAAAIAGALAAVISVPVKAGARATVGPPAVPGRLREARVAIATLPPVAPLYDFRIERGWLRMPDGVQLAVTYFRPVPRSPNEKFPVLVEILPYRKEDSFYRRDYPLYSYFVRRGYVMVKVDIRGSGSSEGRLPPREYSDEELNDAVEVIAQLAKMPGSTGAVGMWGKSWGGFNSIQVAMRHPPALKAILAMYASDDLYHDDVHYNDGLLKVDQYALQMDHENALPAPPDYRTDSAFFANRFDTEPWLLVYLRHPVDDDWWRSHSLRFHFGELQIPAFLIGGLLDGYRDPVIRMLDSVRAPIKAEIGPWKHDYPDDAVPGPDIEWRAQAVRWWDYWLKNAKNGVMDEPRLTLFVRAGQAPDATQQTTAGTWRSEDWPIARTRWRTWYPDGNHRLADQVAGPAGEDLLRYIAGSGTAVPVWWNDPTGNMAADDGTSLVYDGAVLAEPIEVVGLPRVHLQVSATAPIADWTVRLEDVNPDGEVALVTGGQVSGAQRASRLSPSPLTPGVATGFVDTLHFTTWTFQPGHRIRIAIANAQFPMVWPTPYAMSTRLATNDARSALELPVIPTDPHAKVPRLPAPEPRSEAPDARAIPRGPPSGLVVTHDVLAKTTAVEFMTRDVYGIGQREIDNIEKERYETHDEAPADSRFLGDEVHVIRTASGRSIRVRTVIDMRSDSANFHVTITRNLYVGGTQVRARTWTDTIPRGIH